MFDRTSDVILPLYMGDRLNINDITFAIHEGSMHVKGIGNPSVVMGYGKANLKGVVIHRFYLQNVHDESKTAMLQCVMDDLIHTTPGFKEILFFVPYAEVCPVSEEEWDFWLSKKDGSIGLNPFQDLQGNIYDRIWIPSTPPWVAPIDFTEEVIDLNNNKATTRHRAMLYGRWIDTSEQSLEYMLVSTDEDEANAKVVIWAGVEIQPSDVRTTQ